MKSYPGGKSGDGVFQTIISRIPPHHTYIETHLGGGGIMKNKRPAAVNIGIDIDPDVVKFWEAAYTTKMTVGPRADYQSTIVKNTDTGSDTTKNGGWIRQAPSEISSGDDQSLTIINTDAAEWLKEYRFTGNEFVYVDPPYLMRTRKSGKLYNFEYTTHDHIRLLLILKTLPCKVMISGYWSDLYAEMLPGWNTHHFQAHTRRGMATEWLWYNYPGPGKLHDYSFIGEGFRERERIKKKRKRWISRILRLPALEREAVKQDLLNCRSPLTKNNDMDPNTKKDDTSGHITGNNDGIPYRQKERTKIT